MSGLICLPAERMATLPGEILTALAGTTSAKPIRSPDLFARLGVPMRSNALIDLVHRSAVGQANVDRRVEGDTYVGPVYWLTGIASRAVPWRDQAINNHTQADAAASAANPRRAAALDSNRQAAPAAVAKTLRVAKAAAALPTALMIKPIPPEQSRKAGKSGNASKARNRRIAAAHSSITQESNMPRVAVPAMPLTSAPHPGHKKAGNGELRDQVLAALMDAHADEPMTVDRMLPLCPSAASRDSLSATLRDLVKVGTIQSDRRKVGRQSLSHYWMGASATSAKTPASAASAQQVHRPCHQPATVAKPAETDIASMSLEDIGNMPLPPEAWEEVRATAQDGMRFLYSDDGHLVIEDGDEYFDLDHEQTQRLRNFLDVVML